MTDRIHPESLRQIEQLVKLHGINPVLRAIEDIRARDQAEIRRSLEAKDRAEAMAAKAARGAKP